MVTKNPTSWIPQPEGFGYVTNTGAVGNLVDQLGNFIVDQHGNFISNSSQVVSGKYPSSWANNLGKVAGSWNPQPEGFGYVTDFTGVILTTDLNVELTTDLKVPLSTGGSQVVGKYATTWANTGS